MILPDTNNVYLTGKLAAEPSLRELKSGLPVANVKLASVSRFLSTNEVAEITYSNLVFYGPFVALVQSLRAGTRVYVQGELVVRATSTNPQRPSTTTEIVVRVLHELRESSTANDLSDPSAWG
jgi:single-stranded DNA-binding protein